MATNTIDKLSFRNYSTWSCDLKYLLLEKGLWEIIEKKQKSLEISTMVTADDVEKFKSRANKVLSLVYLNIEPEFKRLVADCSEPVEAWECLCRQNMILWCSRFWLSLTISLNLILL